MNKNQQPEITQEQAAMLNSYLQNQPFLKCVCGSEIFNEVTKLKRISKLISGTSNDVLVPIPALVCVKCNKEFSSITEPESVIKTP